MSKFRAAVSSIKYRYAFLSVLGALTSVLIWTTLHDSGRPLRNAVPSEITTSSYSSTLAIAAVIFTVAFPALSAFTIFKRRSLEGVSPTAWLLVSLSAAVWLGYGISVGDAYQVVANAAISVCAVGIVAPLFKTNAVSRKVSISTIALTGLAFFTTVSGGLALSLAATTLVTVTAGVATLASVLASRSTKGVSAPAVVMSVISQSLWVLHGVRTSQPVLVATAATGAAFFFLAAAALAARRLLAQDLDVAAATAMRHVYNTPQPTAALYPVFENGVCKSVSCRASNVAWKNAGLDVSAVDRDFLHAVAEAYRKGHAAVPDNNLAALIRVGPEAVFLYMMPSSGAEEDSSSMEGQVFERAEMARELHDHILSDLHVTGMLLERAAAAKGLSPSEAANMNSRLAHLSGGIRSIIDGRPLESHGPLAVELSDIVATWNAARSGPDSAAVIFKYDGAEPYISDATHHSVIAVVKEAVANAVRHANASQIVVRLETVHPGGAGLFDGLMVSVADNGTGLSELNARTSLSGLTNMQKRISDIGGRMTHFSPIGKPGTTLSFSVPAMSLENTPVLV